MRRDIFFVFVSLVLAGIGACSTDNGDNSHGPDIGPLPKRDGSVEPSQPPDDGGDDTDGGVEGGEPEGGGESCGTVAILAGNDTSLTAAVQENGGAWTSKTITGGAAKSKPALVAFRSGFLGATRGPDNVLQSVASPSWALASPLGTPGVKGAPALAVVGNKAHVVYSTGPNDNHDFTHGIHDGANWNAATAPVGPPPSYATVSAALAGIGSELVFAQNGEDHGLYVRSYDGSWSMPHGVMGAGTIGTEAPATPEMVPASGDIDVLMLYVAKETRYISVATRKAGSKEWAGGEPIPNTVTTNEKFSLAGIGPSKVLLAYRGTDNNSYYTQGTISGSSVTWSSPEPVGGAVDSTPAAAKGVCGDDAVIAYASGGAIHVKRLRGTTLGPDQRVTGASGAFVAVATR